MKTAAADSHLVARRWLAGGLALGALLLAPGAGAAPPSKQQCAQAYAETQSQRQAGKLRAAREQALLCAQPSCPRVVSKDCGVWLEELEQSLPTVVLAARGPTGQDVTEARVTMDGEALAARLDGGALPVDPGEHAFRFEVDGSPPVDMKVVIRMGEKNRRIDASFAPPPPAPAPAPPAPAPGSPSPSVSPAVFILAGVAAAGLGVFATFGTLGENQKRDLEKTCAPNCTLDQASSVRQKLIIGDVGLFTAIAAVVAGTTVFLVGRRTPPPPAAATLRIDVAPLPSGGALAVHGIF